MKALQLFLAGILFSLLFFGCSSNEDDMVPFEIVIVSGDQQVGDIDQEISLPLVAKVVNKLGTGIAGVEVDWLVEKGDGSIIDSEPITNEAGEISASFSVGDFSFLNRIRVRVSDKVGVYTIFRALKAPVMGTMTDPSTGRTYQTVTINDQVWMAENLVKEEGFPGSIYYDDVDVMLYDWGAAMITPDSITYQHRGICPQGWHIPTVDDLIKLADIVDNDAQYLKAEPLGNNFSGFNAEIPNVNYDWIYYEGPDGVVSRWFALWSTSEKFAFNEEWRDVFGFNMLEPSKIIIGPTVVNGLTIYYSHPKEYYNCIRCLKNY